MPSHITNNLSQAYAGNGSVSVSATPVGGTLVRPANPNRLQVFLTNSGSNTVTISLSSNAVAGSGIVLSAGQSTAFQTYTGAIYAITASGSTTVAYTEI
jgi:hypothetical protein